MEPKQILMLTVLIVSSIIGVGTLLYVLANLDKEDENGDDKGGYGGH